MLHREGDGCRSTLARGTCSPPGKPCPIAWVWVRAVLLAGDSDAAAEAASAPPIRVNEASTYRNRKGPMSETNSPIARRLSKLISLDRDDVRAPWSGSALARMSPPKAPERSRPPSRAPTATRSRSRAFASWVISAPTHRRRVAGSPALRRLRPIRAATAGCKPPRLPRPAAAASSLHRADAERRIALAPWRAEIDLVVGETLADPFVLQSPVSHGGRRAPMDLAL